jgi:hypothetical protein
MSFFVKSYDLLPIDKKVFDQAVCNVHIFSTAEVEGRLNFPQIFWVLVKVHGGHAWV